MFRKRNFIITGVLLIIFTHGLVFAGPRSVTVIRSADIPPYNEAMEGFKKACNCSIERIIAPDADAAYSLSMDVRGDGPKVIFALGLDALTLAMKIKEVSIIYAMIPQSALKNLSDPRVSGVGMGILPERFIGAMTELFPSTRRIGVVYDPANTGAYITEAQETARKAGVELVLRRVSRAADVLNAIDSLKNRVDLFWMIPDTTVVNSETFKYFLESSFENRIPLFSFSRKYVELGASAALVSEPSDMGAQAGEIARHIGPADGHEPIRSWSNKAGLTVNKKIIEKLGIRVNESVLRRASNVR